VEGVSGVKAMAEWRNCSGLRSFVAGTVDNVNPKEIPRAHRRTMGRMALLATLASRDAVADANLDEKTFESDRVSAVFGSTTGSAPVFEQFFREYFSRGGFDQIEGTLFMKVMSHTVAANVSAALGIRGRVLAPCSACASSTQAIGMGYEMIRDGIQDIALCGGAEDLHPTTAGVFDILHAASTHYNDSPHRTPRPFDANRDGLVVGEGAAVLVLEEYQQALARKARIRGEVLGYATCGDAHHMTFPSKEGMLRCMREAVRIAGISPGDLHYINAHATGTLIGDAMESEAIYDLVGDSVPVSGTKGYTGHTLAACGAMEAIFCLIMMEEGFLASTLNLDAIGPDCRQIAHVQQLIKCHPRFVLSSNFAFGGVNASLVLGAGQNA